MHAARLAAFLLHLIDSAELDARAPQRLFAREARALILLDMGIEMEAQFIIEFSFGCLSAEQRAETEE